MDNLSHDDSDERLKALKDVLRRGDRGAVPALVERLAAEQVSRLRVAIIFALGKLGDRAVVDVLAPLVDDADSNVRVRAIDALSAAGGGAADPVLVKAIGASDDASVRDRAAHHLAERRGPDLVGLFTRMLASEKVWKREAAVRALAHFDAPRVVSLLVRASQDVEEVVRDAALNGLERLAARGNKPAEAALSYCRVPDAPPADTDDLDSVDDQLSTTYTGAAVSAADLDESFFDVPNEPVRGPAPEEPEPPVLAPSRPRAVVAPPSRAGEALADPLIAPSDIPRGGCRACGRRVPAGVGRCPNCNELLIEPGATPRVSSGTARPLDGRGYRPPPSPLTTLTWTLGLWAFGQLCWVLLSVALTPTFMWSWLWLFPIGVRVLQVASLCALQAGYQWGWWFWMLMALVALFAGVALRNLEMLGSAAALLVVLPRRDVRLYCGLIGEPGAPA